MCWGGCEETGTLIYCWQECKMVQPLWKIMAVHQKFKHRITVTMVIPGPESCAYPKELKVVLKQVHSRTASQQQTIHNGQKVETAQVPINR